MSGFSTKIARVKNGMLTLVLTAIVPAFLFGKVGLNEVLPKADTDLGGGSKASVSATKLPCFTVNGTVTDNTGCAAGHFTGAINQTITPSGVYTFSWDSGQMTEDISGLSAGTYNVTVTDEFGCTETAFYTIADNPNLPNANPSSSSAICNQNNGSASVAPSGGGGAPYTVLWSNGITTNNNPNIPPGSYDVTVTGSNGCSSTATVIVGNISSTLLLNGNTSPNTTCPPNAPNGYASQTVIPVGSYTFIWDSGQTSEDIFGLVGGTYNVTVTSNTSGCTVTGSYTVVNIPNAPSVNQTSTPATCNQNNGSASVAPGGGGGAPYTVLWSNGITTNNNPNIPPGSYGVTVTSNSGCSSTATVPVGNISSALLLNGNTSPNTTCPPHAGNGAVNLTVTPAGSYTFNWESGQTTEDISGLSPGIYNVTVTAASGCTGTGTYTVGDNPALPNANPSSISATCDLSNGSASVAPSGGGGGPYTVVWSNGIMTNNNPNIPPGSYDVTVTSSNGCSTTANVVLGNVTTTVNLSANITTNTTCPPHAGNGAINLTVTPAGSYTFNWESGQMTEDLSGLSPGTYNVTVTAASGCTGTGSYTVGDNPALPSANPTSTSATCNQSNGSASVAPSGGGGAPYTVVWSNGIMTDNNPNIPSGTYTVTVTGSNGCSTTATVSVGNNNPAIDLSGTTSPNTICNTAGGNGAVDLTVSPSGTYNYSWNSGQMTEDISGLNPGNYTVTVTSSTGCTATSSFNIANNTPAPTANPSSISATCNLSNGSASIAPSGGGGAPYTIVWSNGIMTDNNPNTPSGTYTVTVTGSNGCSTTATVSVDNNNPAIDLSGITSPNTTCNPAGGNGAVDLIVSPSGTYNYSWNSGQMTEDISGLNPGNYTVTVTSSTGCTATSSFNIANNTPAPTANPSSISATCNLSNGSASVAPSGGGGAPYTIVWSNGIMTDNNPNIPSGTYTVTVTGSNGCSTTATVSVDNNNPAIDLSGITSPNTTCNPAGGNGAVDLNVSPSGTYNYSWNSGQMTEDISGLNPGNYTVTVTNSTGCTATSSFNIANNTPAPAANPSSISATCNLSNGSASIAPSGGGGAPYTIVWSNGIMTDNNPNIPAGTYTVTVTGSNGCSTTATVSVGNTNQVISLSGATTLNTSCNPAGGNGAVDLSVSPAGAYTFNWSSGQLSEDISGLNPGIYFVTVSSSAGCTTSANFTVSQGSGVSIICSQLSPVSSPGGTDGAGRVNISGGVAPYTVDWSPGGMQAGVPAGDFDITGLASGVYGVTVTDQSGCTQTCGFTIQQPGCNMTLSSSIVNLRCHGVCNGAINVSPSGANGVTTYVWSDGNNNPNRSGLCSSIYTVTATDGVGCSATLSATITEPPVLSATAATTPVLCFGAATGCIQITSIGGTPPYNHVWNNGASTEDVCNLNAGNFCTTITDALGCTFDTCLTIQQPATAVQAVCAMQSPANIGAGDGIGTVTISGGTPVYGVAWSGAESGSQANLSAGVFTLNNLNPGNYNVTVTDANGCTDVCQFSIQQLGCTYSVGSMASGQQAICGTGCITAAYNNSEQNSNGGVLEFILHSGAGVGIVGEIQRNSSPVFCFNNTSMTFGQSYYISAVVGNNDGAGHVDLADVCTLVAPGTPVVWHEIPLAAIQNPGVLSCIQTTVTLTGSGSGNPTFLWSASNGGNIVGNNTDTSVLANKAGDYRLIVTNQGCADTAQVNVQDISNNPQVSISAIPAEVINCLFKVVQLNGQALGTNNPAYNWLENGVTVSTQQNIMINHPGLFILQLKDTQTGCTAVDSITISADNAYPPLTAQIPPTLNCLTTSAALNGGSSVGASIQLEWARITSGDTTYLATGSTLAVNAPGTYYLFGYDPGNGCHNGIPVTVAQNITPPLANAGPDEAIDCNQTTVSLQGSAGPAGAMLSYNWTSANPNAVIQNPNTLTPTVSNTGIYVLTVQNSSNFCSKTDSVEVTQVAPFTGSFIAKDPRCFGDQNGKIEVLAPGNRPPYTYYLNNVSAGSNKVFESLAAGNYSIKVEDGAGCVWETSTSLLAPAPVQISLGDDVTANNWDTITILAATNVPLQAIEKLSWTPASWFTCSDPICFEQRFSPQQNGVIEATLVDTNGCKASDNLKIVVNKNFDIYVPNVFSPDGDGINDVFTIYGGRGIREISHFSVYDRWGEQVWLADHFQPNDDRFGWNGQHRGAFMTPGVFVYVVEIKLLDGNTVLLKGDITLYR